MKSRPYATAFWRQDNLGAYPFSFHCRIAEVSEEQAKEYRAVPAAPRGSYALVCRDERNNTFHELEPIHPEMAVLVPILSWPAKRFQYCHRFTCVLISIQVQFQPRSSCVRAAYIYSANPCFPNSFELMSLQDGSRIF